jgi:hypothetical protein
MRVARDLWDSPVARDYAVTLRAESPMTFRSRIAPVTLALPAQAARLRGAAPDRTDLLLFTTVPLERFHVPVGDSVLTGILVFAERPGFPVVADERRTHAARGQLLLDYRIPLVAGRYHVSVEALARNAATAARLRDSIEAPAWHPESLLVSDIVLAHIVEPRGVDPREWGDLRVVPSRALALPPGATVWAVWETYGLDRGPAGTARYQVRLRLRDARDRHWPLRLIERLGIGRAWDAGGAWWRSGVRWPKTAARSNSWRWSWRMREEYVLISVADARGRAPRRSAGSSGQVAGGSAS